METQARRCAGLDVHQKTVTAAVRKPNAPGHDRVEVAQFPTTHRGLEQLRQWLAAREVTLVGMESTGVYWKPVFFALEEQFCCWLLNAQHVKNLVGRKTDMADASWLAELLEGGYVRPSFVPPRWVRELRELTRYRKALTQERSRQIQRLDKVLEDAGIKLSSVASNLLIISCRRMIERLIAGERDPEVLANLALGRLRQKLGALREALQGHFQELHAFLADDLLHQIDTLDASIARVSEQIAERTAAAEEAIVLLDGIPGISRMTAEVIIAEIGTDMSVFPSARHLSSWAGVCPGNNESAGKRRAARARKGDRALRTALVESANALVRSRSSYLAVRYQRLKARRGAPKAALAVAHELLVIVYHVLRDRTPYADLGPDYFRNRDAAWQTRRLVRQLERLRHRVTLEPAA